MSDIHPLYARIINQLISQDKRAFLPERALRVRELSNYLTHEREQDTELFTIKPDPAGDLKLL